MRLDPAVTGFTDQMVADCALGSASIFFYDENAGAANLAYLYHVGVTEEAQHCYSDARIFETDPFTRQLLAHRDASGGRFVRWGDTSLDRFVERDYTSFLDHYAVDVVGACTRTLGAGLCLIIGAHRRGGKAREREVDSGLLEQRIKTLSNMVVDCFLADLVDSRDGRAALRSLFGFCNAAHPYGLSRREGQLAELVCRGLQNKAIAFELGLSEYTVENYLRRLYRKLGVRNRAGLVFKMSN